MARGYVKQRSNTFKLNLQGNSAAQYGGQSCGSQPHQQRRDLSMEENTQRRNNSTFFTCFTWNQRSLRKSCRFFCFVAPCFHSVFTNNYCHNVTQPSRIQELMLHESITPHQKTLCFYIIISTFLQYWFQLWIIIMLSFSTLAFHGYLISIIHLMCWCPQKHGKLVHLLQPKTLRFEYFHHTSAPLHVKEKLLCSQLLISYLLLIQKSIQYIMIYSYWWVSCSTTPSCF